MNEIKKNMFMITGAWGSGRSLRAENRFSGDYYYDDRFPKAKRMFQHPDNCYNSWPNIIANNINASIHWVGSDYNHTTNSMNSFASIFQLIEESYANEDAINFYFVCLNGVYDMEKQLKVGNHMTAQAAIMKQRFNPKDDFWSNYKKVHDVYKKSILQFRRGWVNMKECITKSNYNNRLIFFIQDKQKIDDEFRNLIDPDHLSIDDHLERLVEGQEYAYFIRQPLDVLVERAWLKKSRQWSINHPVHDECLDQRQMDTLGENVHSWLTNNTNCFNM